MLATPKTKTIRSPPACASLFHLRRRRHCLDSASFAVPKKKPKLPHSRPAGPLDHLAIADLQFSSLILRDPVCSCEEKLFGAVPGRRSKSQLIAIQKHLDWGEKVMKAKATLRAVLISAAFGFCLSICANSALGQCVGAYVAWSAASF